MAFLELMNGSKGCDSSVILRVGDVLLGRRNYTLKNTYGREIPNKNNHLSLFYLLSESLHNPQTPQNVRPCLYLGGTPYGHLRPRGRQNGRHFCAFDRPVKPCKASKHVG